MLGTFGPKGKHSGAFPGFSFCLVYLRLGDVQESRNVNGYRQNSISKNLATGPRKGQPHKTENFSAILYSILVKKHREKYSSISTQVTESQVESPS